MERICFLNYWFQMSIAGVNWFTVVIQLYDSSHFTPGVTLQHHNLNVNPIQTVEGGDPLGGSFFPFKHPWITWVLNRPGLNCWNPQPSPVLRAPSQFCDWFFLGAAWPMGVNRTSSRLSFFTEPEGTGWSRVKVHILLPLLPLSAFSPHSPLIDALWSCSPSHRSPAVCFLSRWVLTWQSNSYCECERSAPLPHACVHACVHAHAHTHTTHTHILSSWTAAILIIMKQRHSDGEV